MLERSYHRHLGPTEDPCRACGLPYSQHYTKETRKMKEDFLSIPKLTKPKDPARTARHEKTLELQERRVAVKELMAKMREATHEKNVEMLELLHRACDSLDGINQSLKALIAVSVAEKAVGAVGKMRKV